LPTESEYVALSEAGQEAIWLRNLYAELGFIQNSPTEPKGDNKGSIMLTHNPQFHNQSKHITIWHHWIRDLMNDKILNITNCHDPQQMADMLTKPLAKPKFT
jgi:hypothetical protein